MIFFISSSVPQMLQQLLLFVMVGSSLSFTSTTTTTTRTAFLHHHHHRSPREIRLHCDTTMKRFCRGSCGNDDDDDGDDDDIWTNINDKNNDSFDMDELRHRIRYEERKHLIVVPLPSPPIQQKQQQPSSSHSLLNKYSPATTNNNESSRKLQQPLEHVYIVSFIQSKTTNNVVDTSCLYQQQQDHDHNDENNDHSCSSSSTTSTIFRGIHSIEYPSGQNVILAFTNANDCNQLVQQLLLHNFPFTPTTQRISVEALVVFCLRVNVLIEIVPEGVNIIPPQQYVQPLGILQHQHDEPSRGTLQQQQMEDSNFAFHMLNEMDEFVFEGEMMSDPYHSSMDDGFSIADTATTTTLLSIFE